MAGIVVFLLISFQMRLCFFNRTHRQGNSDKLAALLGINSLGRDGYGFIRIFAHAAKDTTLFAIRL